MVVEAIIIIIQVLCEKLFFESCASDECFVLRLDDDESLTRLQLPSSRFISVRCRKEGKHTHTHGDDDNNKLNRQIIMLNTRQQSAVWILLFRHYYINLMHYSLYDFQTCYCFLFLIDTFRLVLFLHELEFRRRNEVIIKPVNW